MYALSYTHTHAHIHTANPVHVMKSPLLAEEFIHGSRVYLGNVKPYQIFGNTPHFDSCDHDGALKGREKTVGWIEGRAGTSKQGEKNITE